MKNQNRKKTLSGCFFCLIVVISGCVDIPRTALKVELSRISNSNEELAIISFLEKYDFLEFTGLDYDDDRYISGAKDLYGSFQDVFIGNISNLLVSAETLYEERTSYKKGELSYHIALSNVSFSERDDIIIKAKQISQRMDVSDTILDTLQFGAFKMSEDNCSIFDNETPIPQEFWTLMNLTDWFWVSVLDFNYTIRQNLQQDEFHVAAIIIVTPTSEVLGLMSKFSRSGWVA
jgi:hypothetical protein